MKLAADPMYKGSVYVCFCMFGSWQGVNVCCVNFMCAQCQGVHMVGEWVLLLCCAL